MEHSEIEQNGTCLKTTLKLANLRNERYFKDIFENYYQVFDSQDFIVCGLVSFQMRVEAIRITNRFTCSVLIKLLELNNFDNATVSIIFSSKELNVNKTFLVDDSDWRYVGNYDHCEFVTLFQEHKLDVNVELNIKDCIPPVFANLHDDKELVDLELRGVDGSVLVHKAVLAGCSTVFRQELSAQYVQVQHATQLTLQQLKDFMYLRVLPDDMDKVVEIASFYKIEGLELQCFNRLITQFTEENRIKLLEYAMKYDMKKIVLAFLTSLQKDTIDIENVRF